VELNLESVDFSYGAKSVFRGLDIHLSILNGGMVAVVGPNGAGKSTLLGIISGFLRPSKGIVKINGYDVHRVPSKWRRRWVSVVFPDRVVPADIPVWSVVAAGRLYEPVDFDRLKDILSTLGILHLFERSFASLSSGERHLVLIASAIYQNADVMLFDEPTSFLDPIHVLTLLDVFPVLAKEHLIVFSSHDLPFVRTLSDTIIGIREGNITYLGNGEDFWTSGFEKVFGVGYGYYRQRLLW